MLSFFIPNNKVIKIMFRTKEYGCWEVIDSSDYWGRYFKQTTDPDGIDATLEQLRSFELKQNFPRLPKRLLDHIVSLMKQFSIEVQVVLARHEQHKEQWRVFVPKQTNTAASVNADTTHLVDLLTGETFTDGLPVGWLQAGTSHSHPSMQAFFSATDDASELTSPGLHFTIGGSKWGEANYTICSSICLGGNRYVLDPNKLVDCLPKQKQKHIKKVTEHVVTSYVSYPLYDAVLDQITVYKPKPVAKTWNNRNTTTFPQDDWVDVLYPKSNYNLNPVDVVTELADVDSVIQDYLMEGGNVNDLLVLLSSYTEVDYAV